MHHHRSGSEEGASSSARSMARFFLPQERWSGLVRSCSVRVEGGSFGFQIGGSETDVFMLVMNESGVKRLLATKFTLVAMRPLPRVPWAFGGSANGCGHDG